MMHDGFCMHANRPTFALFGTSAIAWFMILVKGFKSTLPACKIILITSKPICSGLVKLSWLINVVNGTCKFEEEMEKKKPRVLCLHGFRTSGEIMSTQMKKWPAHILDRLDLVFLDGLYPAQGPSAVEGLFPPPYYEWFQFNKAIILFLFICFFNFFF